MQLPNFIKDVRTRMQYIRKRQLYRNLVFKGGGIRGIAFIFPHRAEESLGWMKSTIDRYRHQIGIWLPLGFGILFVVRGLRGIM
jgi:hypothetical protein